ncbi:amidohydrolase [Pseudooceanicola sediminis]|uniref:Amidohydrolase n=1 Tax=Pseudooceanicola sediminis TaxID=2211117 RepID=A0A399J431_9RHOB|nr:amidohydrolase family protein [Pseudooceanicola sediminis]KAA2313907.1 amidohydrolase [Puniceibacterium sp. HSS470]RII38722.1 amidohydrolase [Pseudooceanicola sediminis]|tara:strand:+ start:30071 stop:31138 length:1068 start_codon:yes stop_codon:yes gene_type:complete
MTNRYPEMPPRNPNPPYKRIAAEEAWLPPEIMNLYIKGLEDGSIQDPGFRSLWGFFAQSKTEKAQAHFRRIQTLGEERLADMDGSGIDMQVVALSSPGVQVFEAKQASALARSANDQLAEGIAANPDRYVGLAAFSPLDIGGAEQELERGVTKLGLRGGILNSHTLGTYLDDERYWGLFEAAEALDVPIYLHPNTPPPQMIEPFLNRGLDAAIYGFACETGLHALRLIVAGVFDRFPKLQIILGHCGEALPYWLYRIDYMHGHISKTGRYPDVKPLQRRTWDYLIDNFYYTSSGVGWAPPIEYVRNVISPERMLYAMDYPWQFVPEEVGALDAMGIGENGLKQFFEGNARRLFKI